MMSRSEAAATTGFALMTVHEAVGATFDFDEFSKDANVSSSAIRKDKSGALHILITAAPHQVMSMSLSQKFILKDENGREFEVPASKIKTIPESAFSTDETGRSDAKLSSAPALEKAGASKGVLTGSYTIALVY